jgi:hypothetical protein
LKLASATAFFKAVLNSVQGRACPHHETASEKYQFTDCSGKVYWCLCAPLFQFSVSWSSKVQFGVIYLKTWASTQPDVAFWTLEFYSCFFVFSGTHTTTNSLTFQRPVFIVSCVKSS